MTRMSVLIVQHFRFCVSEDDRDRLLDAEIWPDSVSIYEWYFKPPNSNDKHRRVEKTPSRDRVAAEVRDCDASQVTTMVTRQTLRPQLSTSQVMIQ